VIDALLYAVRDAIRAAGMNYDQATCAIMDDGQPPPRCGNYFTSIHGSKSNNKAVRNLDEIFDFSITLTERITVPLDRLGEQQMARNIELVPLGYRQGFNNKVERLRAFVAGASWRITVLTGQNPNSANDNLSEWATGMVYGFCEPYHYQGVSAAVRLVGGEWFASDPESEEMGLVQELRFGGARRMQPHSAVIGPFV
jgi:hypothetical protein